MLGNSCGNGNTSTGAHQSYCLSLNLAAGSSKGNKLVNCTTRSHFGKIINHIQIFLSVILNYFIRFFKQSHSKAAPLKQMEYLNYEAPTMSSFRLRSFHFGHPFKQYSFPSGMIYSAAAFLQEKIHHKAE